MIRIPIYRPSLTGKEKQYVMECLDSTWISSRGQFINLFERAFAEKIGVQHATTVSNGTVALHLALVALGIGSGDEVIVPTLTYIATVNSIAYTGARPVFVDSLRKTWQIDPEDIRKKITSRTRAIMLVHLYGHPCEMDEIMKIAGDYNLFVIEDCAEAIGSLYKGRAVGSFGHISTFSFFGNKTITTGEGGMLVTNDQTLYERAVHFKGQGLAAHRQYWHDVIGYNYRMTNICAGIGLAQLEQIETFIERKREIAAFYREALRDLPTEFHEEASNVLHTYWMVSILVKGATTRERLREHLAANGVETRPLFYPVHTMPMYSSKFQRLPIAEELGWCGINLPSWPGLQTEQLHEIVSYIKGFFSASRNEQ